MKRKQKLLKLWKSRQEAEGYDVSGVNTLEEAEHFLDKKEEPEAVPEAELEKETPKKPTTKAGTKKKV